MIEAIDLTKYFGAVSAAKNISFTVSPGEVVGLLGPNGAGKTTTFRMISGTLGPTSGTVRLCGKDLTEDPIGAKRALGYMPENAPLYPELTGNEYLNYRAALKGIPSKDRHHAIKRAAAQTSISDHLGARIAHLSKGYRQRLALADALLGDPPVLLLDEPTAGLDPNQVQDVRALISELGKNHAILLSTHILSEVEATCQRAIVINQGSIVAQGTLSELGTRRGNTRVRLVVGGTKADVLACFSADQSQLPSIIQPLDDEDRFVVEVDLESPRDLGELLTGCLAAGLQIFEAAPKRAALDQVFAELTRSPSVDQSPFGNTSPRAEESTREGSR